MSAVQRKPASREPLVRILVVCEGEKTEPLYFKALKNDILSQEVTVTYPPSKCTDPDGLIRFAQDTFKAGFNNGHETSLRPKGCDEIYVLFDRDEHQGYANAITKGNNIKALKNDFGKPVKFKVLPSNPCFELWFVLHFRQVHNLPDRNSIFLELKNTLEGGYRKSDEKIYDKIKDKTQDACKNANILNRDSDPYNTEKGYTAAVTLVERFIKLSKKYGKVYGIK